MLVPYQDSSMAMPSSASWRSPTIEPGGTDDEDLVASQEHLGLVRLREFDRESWCGSRHRSR